MNLDIKNPDSRKRIILENIHPDLLIAMGDKPEFALSLPMMEISLNVSSNINEEKATSLREGIIDTDLACLINTSGSTGVPKAVAITHRGLIDFTEAVREAGLAPDSAIVGSLSPIIFDIWCFELCMLMAYGSSLRLLPDSAAAFPARLLEIMAESHVNFIFWVPTIMVNIANMDLLAKIHLPDLRMVWFAGEVFPTTKFNYWRKNLPNAKFANFYGPIEISLDCLYWVADRELSDSEPIPIGGPFPNTGILILGDDGDPIEQAHKEGELYVLGSSLAAGYYNAPEKTATAFIQNPLNHAYPETIYRTGDIVAYNDFSELIFRGRRDTLIKHLGYRVELSEIEHIVVDKLALTPNCCVLYDPRARQIILIYEQGEYDERQIRHSLTKELPRYMLPAVFHSVAALPRNANGKIDRNGLAETYLDKKL